MSRIRLLVKEKAGLFMGQRKGFPSLLTQQLDLLGRAGIVFDHFPGDSGFSGTQTAKRRRRGSYHADPFVMLTCSHISRKGVTEGSGDSGVAFVEMGG
jgi:hypothetical protein